MIRCNFSRFDQAEPSFWNRL